MAEVPKAQEKDRKRIKVASGTHLPEGKKTEQGQSPKENKGTDPKKSISYDENRISSDEFSDLEKKEGKRIKTKESEKPSSESRAHSSATDTDMLLLKTEKIEGKIEAIEDGNKAVEERLSTLNQEIGELRSSVMEKDRMVRDFQQGFVKIKDMAEGMEPGKIQSQFTKKEEAIEKNLAAIESLNMQVGQVKEDIKANKKVLESLRDVKGLTELIGNLREKVDKVEDDRKFTSRTAGKVETMFSDLAGKLAEFQSYKDKIAFNEETMHEIMKTMDSIETSLQESVRKDDIKKFHDSVEENFSKVDTRIDDKLYDIRNLLDELLTGLKKAGVKGVLESVGKSRLQEMFATKDDMEEIKARLGALRDRTMDMAKEKQDDFRREIEERTIHPEPRRDPPKNDDPKPEKSPPKATEAKKAIPLAPLKKVAEKVPLFRAPGDVPTPGPVEGIRNQIDSMIDQAEESVRMGNLDIAKNLYREALNMYSQLNKAETYQDAAQVYERIRRLYSRLRIYS